MRDKKYKPQTRQTGSGIQTRVQPSCAAGTNADVEDKRGLARWWEQVIPLRDKRDKRDAGGIRC